jgi:hypothetical protein
VREAPVASPSVAPVASPVGDRGAPNSSGRPPPHPLLPFRRRRRAPPGKARAVPAAAALASPRTGGLDGAGPAGTGAAWWSSGGGRRACTQRWPFYCWLAPRRCVSMAARAPWPRSGPSQARFGQLADEGGGGAVRWGMLVQCGGWSRTWETRRRRSSSRADLGLWARSGLVGLRPRRLLSPTATKCLLQVILARFLGLGSLACLPAPERGGLAGSDQGWPG